MYVGDQLGKNDFFIIIFLANCHILFFFFFFSLSLSLSLSKKKKKRIKKKKVV